MCNKKYKVRLISVIIALIFCFQSISFAAEDTSDAKNGTTDADIYGASDETPAEPVVIDDSADYSFSDVSDAEMSKKIGLLTTLGFAEVKDGKFRPDDKITRYEAALALFRILNGSDGVYDVSFYDMDSSDERYSPMAFAYENDFIGAYNNNTIRPDEYISSKKLARALLLALGYESDIAAYNSMGNDGVYITARRTDLLGNIPYSDDALSRNDAALLIYNALTTEVKDIAKITKSAYDSNEHIIHYEKAEDKTLLSIYHNIYYGEGRMTSIPGSALGDYKEAESGYVGIDGINYAYSEQSTLDRFARNCVFFYRQQSEASSKKEIVYIYKDSNVKEITVSSYNIISYKGNVLKYYDVSKTKTVKISSDFEYIKNNKILKGDVDNILPDNGSITLIANNGSYDTVVVWEYFNAVLKSFSADGAELNVCYDYGIPAVKLNLYNTTIDTFLKNKRTDVSVKIQKSIDSSGTVKETVTLPNVASGSLVSVFADKTEIFNGKTIISDEATYVRFVINSDPQEGTVTYMGTNTLKVDDVRYFISDDNFLSDNEKQLTVGRNGKFYTDYNGEIAHWTYSAVEGELEYGYLIDAALNGSLKKELDFKILKKDGTISIFTASEYFKLNGDKKTKETAYTELGNSAKLINPSFNMSQIIKYKINSSGNVTEMQTVTASKGVGSGFPKEHISLDTDRQQIKYNPGWGNVFVQYERLNTMNSSGTMASENLYSTHYAGEPDVFFVVPATETKEDEDYAASKSLKMNDFENTELYDVDEMNHPGAAVVYSSVDAQYLANPIIVVSHISIANDANGDERIYINGQTGQGGERSYPCKTNEVAQNIKEGDIIMASGFNGVIYEYEYMGNVHDILNKDMSESILIKKTKNTLIDSDYRGYCEAYEVYDYDAVTKMFVLQRGNLTDNGDFARDYSRVTWWPTTFPAWGGSISLTVNDEGKINFTSGTAKEVKSAVDYSTSDCSRVWLLESGGYTTRVLVIINRE